jgi:type IV fimbrial biogenesis protein FimT
MKTVPSPNMDSIRAAQHNARSTHLPPRRSRDRLAASGFTIIELMMAVAIAAILATIAVPSFSGSIARNRVSSISSDYVAALNVARSEAIRRSRPVTLLSKGTSGSFTEGWEIITDENGDGAKPSTVTDSDGRVLRDHEAIYSSLTLKGVNADNSANSGIHVIFNSRGVLNGGSPQYFSLCHTNTAIKGRKVTVFASGRIKVEEFTCS